MLTTNVHSIVIRIITFVLLLVFGSPVALQADHHGDKETEEKHTHEARFDVEDLNTVELAKRVEKELSEMEGITEYNADPDAKQAAVYYIPDKTSGSEVQRKLIQLGLTPVEAAEAKTCSPDCTSACCDLSERE